MTTGINWTPDLIRRFRTRHHFTLTSFGRAMGATGALEVRPFSRQAVQSWEAGKYLPSIDALRALDFLADNEKFIP